MISGPCPGILPSLGIAGVKIVNVHPDNPKVGLPTVMALTIILDTATGQADGYPERDPAHGHADRGGRSNCCKIPCTKKRVRSRRYRHRRAGRGTGACDRQELSLTGVRVWSRNPAHAEAFAARLAPLLQKASLSKKPATAISLSPRPRPVSPIVKSEWIHRARISMRSVPMHPEKRNSTRRSCTGRGVFVDDPAQAFHSGEINVPISRGLYQPWMISGTLGEVVIGKRKRESKDEITVFDSTGLAIQDLAIASIAMQPGNGMELPFL